VLLKCSALLRRAVGADFAYEEPTRMIRSLWQSNPYFCGSYSFRSKKSIEFDVCPSDLAEPVADSNGSLRLLFAGEATHDHRYSTVHAAVETGWREADRIMEFVKETKFSAKL
jgi:spermine oxidase